MHVIYCTIPVNGIHTFQVIGKIQTNMLVLVFFLYAVQSSDYHSHILSQSATLYTQ